jgi:hypothetical protein
MFFKKLRAMRDVAAVAGFDASVSSLEGVPANEVKDGQGADNRAVEDTAAVANDQPTDEVFPIICHSCAATCCLPAAIPIPFPR